MFLDASRYAKVKTAQVRTRDGRTVTVVTVRRLPPTSGDPTPVTGADRLDVIALRKYDDGTRFWHVADANSELDARDLLKPAPAESANPPAPVINVPAS